MSRASIKLVTLFATVFLCERRFLLQRELYSFFRVHVDCLSFVRRRNWAFMALHVLSNQGGIGRFSFAQADLPLEIMFASDAAFTIRRACVSKAESTFPSSIAKSNWFNVGASETRLLTDWQRIGRKGRKGKSTFFWESTKTSLGSEKEHIPHFEQQHRNQLEDLRGGRQTKNDKSPVCCHFPEGFMSAMSLHTFSILNLGQQWNPSNK